MAEIGDNYLERFRSSAQTAFTQQSGAMETCLQRDELMSVWAASDFVANSCIGNPGMLYELISSGDLDRIYAVGELEARVCQSIDNVEEAAALHAALRRLRKREMIRVAWRDLSGLAGLEETMANVSELARACIDQALGHHHRWLTARFGRPCDSDGCESGMVVLGLGKLGGNTTRMDPESTTRNTSPGLVRNW
jgi:glutamate-ammonia-ligase adenylyltransferase